MKEGYARRAKQYYRKADQLTDQGIGTENLIKAKNIRFKDPALQITGGVFYAGNGYAE